MKKDRRGRGGSNEEIIEIRGSRENIEKKERDNKDE